ncbi:MAG: hypothetical protein ACR2N2_01895 [Acidimicrobiia bacterium]
MSGLLTAVDELYDGCVTDPASWHDQAFVDWGDAVATSYTLDRQSARAVRRCLNAGRKLQLFWVDRSTAQAPTAWRSRVDLALGARAWRPQLELAEYLLDRDGDEAVFDVVTALFPLVRNQPFMDGVAYDEWLASR